MRKTMYKSVLAVIAAGLLSVGMATAETLDTPDTTDQAGSTKTLDVYKRQQLNRRFVLCIDHCWYKISS